MKSLTLYVWLVYDECYCFANIYEYIVIEHAWALTTCNNLNSQNGGQAYFRQQGIKVFLFSYSFEFYYMYMKFSDKKP